MAAIVFLNLNESSRSEDKKILLKKINKHGKEKAATNPAPQ